MTDYDEAILPVWTEKTTKREGWKQSQYTSERAFFIIETRNLVLTIMHFARAEGRVGENTTCVAVRFVIFLINTSHVLAHVFVVGTTRGLRGTTTESTAGGRGERKTSTG